MKSKKTVKKALFSNLGKMSALEWFYTTSQNDPKMSHKINRAKLGKRNVCLWVKVEAGAEQREVRTVTIPRTLESLVT